MSSDKPNKQRRTHTQMEYAKEHRNVRYISKAYPFDEWFDFRDRTEPLRLVRGVDFQCQPHSLSVQLRQAASVRGLKFHIFIENDVVTVFDRELEA